MLQSAIDREFGDVVNHMTLTKDVRLSHQSCWIYFVQLSWLLYQRGIMSALYRCQMVYAIYQQQKVCFVRVGCPCGAGDLEQLVGLTEERVTALSLKFNAQEVP